ncbi:hypothetical protein [Zooshikella harenae]|uniref:Lipoprotein n=1 Tax=Zooshikella harenae TaxID=2827238 RepID=A0ABS5Z738_9GAMM|nr:hypothetical protein [Zooshikella harenae]MBU2709864.1 hypothetical protein [Zooshikella harenae]
MKGLLTLSRSAVVLSCTLPLLSGCLVEQAKPYQNAPEPEVAAIQDNAQLAALKKQALLIEAQQDTLHKISGTWQDGDSFSTYDAFLEQGQLRFIQERRKDGKRIEGSHKYYFSQGRLFHYAEKSTHKVLNNDGPISIELHEVKLFFNSQGQQLFGQQWKNMKPQGITQQTITGIKQHVGHLQAIVKKMSR